MNIREFRSIMQTALRSEGLQPFQLVPKAPKAWMLASDDVIRFFQPHPHRRSWGFVYSGFVGIEILPLRDWLRTYKPGDEGVFRTWFMGYSIANEDVLNNFTINHDDPVPADLWAGLIRDRLDRIPSTLNELITIYRRNREELGWLAHFDERHAWKFLLRWNDDPDASLHVPKRQPDGRIV